MRRSRTTRYEILENEALFSFSLAVPDLHRPMWFRHLLFEWFAPSFMSGKQKGKEKKNKPPILRTYVRSGQHNHDRVPAPVRSALAQVSALPGKYHY
jgi:hypothetical protein